MARYRHQAKAASEELPELKEPAAALYPTCARPENIVHNHPARRAGCISENGLIREIAGGLEHLTTELVTRSPRTARTRITAMTTTDLAWAPATDWWAHRG
jgi:hypothetical protein